MEVIKARGLVIVVDGELRLGSLPQNVSRRALVVVVLEGDRDAASGRFLRQMLEEPIANLVLFRIGQVEVQVDVDRDPVDIAEKSCESIAKRRYPLRNVASYREGVEEFNDPLRKVAIVKRCLTGPVRVIV